MADYISREAALEMCDDDYDRIRIRGLPAADVVEVVRCKDCINWNGNDCVTLYGLYAPRPNDYCSRGEKNSG